ncbi:hypothetical protein DFJ73DRAFT_965936 [Zopfochytrium polystomum]|nr:hypothetical protein DFJ73DRAFT_965936 [Zopfochytrium polystomum]
MPKPFKNPVPLRGAPVKPQPAAPNTRSSPPPSKPAPPPPATAASARRRETRRRRKPAGAEQTRVGGVKRVPGTASFAASSAAAATAQARRTWFLLSCLGWLILFVVALVALVELLARVRNRGHLYLAASFLAYWTYLDLDPLLRFFDVDPLTGEFLSATTNDDDDRGVRRGRRSREAVASGRRKWNSPGVMGAVWRVADSLRSSVSGGAASAFGVNRRMTVDCARDVGSLVTGREGTSSSRGTANSTSSKTVTSAWDLAESFLATFTGSSSDQRPFDQTLESSETHSRWSNVATPSLSRRGSMGTVQATQSANVSRGASRFSVFGTRKAASAIFSEHDLVSRSQEQEQEEETGHLFGPPTQRTFGVRRAVLPGLVLPLAVGGGSLLNMTLIPTPSNILASAVLAVDSIRSSVSSMVESMVEGGSNDVEPLPLEETDADERPFRGFGRVSATGGRLEDPTTVPHSRTSLTARASTSVGTSRASVAAPELHFFSSGRTSPVAAASSPRASVSNLAGLRRPSISITAPTPSASNPMHPPQQASGLPVRRDAWFEMKPRITYPVRDDPFYPELAVLPPAVWRVLDTVDSVWGWGVDATAWVVGATTVAPAMRAAKVVGRVVGGVEENLAWFASDFDAPLNAK